MKRFQFWVNLQWKDINELQHSFLDLEGGQIRKFLRKFIYTFLNITESKF